MKSKKYITRRNVEPFYVLDNWRMYITFCEAHRATPCLTDFEGEGCAFVKRMKAQLRTNVEILILNFYNDDYTSNTTGERRENRSLAKTDGIR